MLTKQSVIESLEKMPEKFSIDDLMDQLIFLQKVEKGLVQSESGEVYSTEETKKILKDYDKSKLD
ncbi:MAG: hypothetical protein NW226_13320 [Microscillaceae bacterium]|nr:hypothetical protein [Microscillaceae bacterium]